MESDADLAAEESEVPVSGDELDGPVEQGSNKKPRLQGLYRPPTHSELQALKETQELFKSNLMKLQVNPHIPVAEGCGSKRVFHVA